MRPMMMIFIWWGWSNLKIITIMMHNWSVFGWWEGYQENHAKLTWVGGPDGLILWHSDTGWWAWDDGDVDGGGDGDGDGGAEMGDGLLQGDTGLVEMACAPWNPIHRSYTLCTPSVSHWSYTLETLSVSSHWTHCIHQEKNFGKVWFGMFNKNTLQYLSC